MDIENCNQKIIKYQSIARKINIILIVDLMNSIIYLPNNE